MLKEIEPPVPEVVGQMAKMLGVYNEFWFGKESGATDKILENLIDKSRKYEPAYLAFQAVRRFPEKARLTGLEPKCIEEVENCEPREIADYLTRLAAGQIKTQKLINIKRWKRMTKVLAREEFDPQGLVGLDGVFAVINAQLNAVMSRHPEARRFREKTYEALGNQGIHYLSINTNDGFTIRQSYRVPELTDSMGILRILPEHEDGMKDWWLLDPENPMHFLLTIGFVGHPLVRAGIQYLPKEVINAFDGRR